ncbi:MAG: hypothetical protein AAFN79_10515 [Pseudomonadota bacterium]
MRSALFILALAGFIAGLGKIVASSEILGLLPFQWWGVAGLTLTLMCGVYLGLEARTVLDHPDDRDDPRI